MGRPFDAGQDLAAIAGDHDQARIGGRAFHGIFQDESDAGGELGGPTFVTAAINIFDADIDREVTQATTITIRGTDYTIDGRQPDGRGTIKLILTPA
jgi:hypothetical protein